MRTNLFVCALVVLASCGDDPKPTPAPNAPTTNALDVRIQGPTSAEEGQLLELECTVSGSPESALRVTWLQNGVQPKASLPKVPGPHLKLQAPEWIADYDLVLQAHVESGSSVVDQVFTIRVKADDDPVRASFVAPGSAECGELVSLIAQTHNEVFQPTQVEWKQAGDGPRVQFDASDRHQAHFFAPEHEGPYALEIELHASDGVNAPEVSRMKIEIECDPIATPLPAGSTLVLASTLGVDSPLPRGAWELEGTLALATKDASTPAQARLRLASGPLCAALVLDVHGGEAQLSTAGLSRTPEGAWIEPEFKSGMPLGPWPADVALGFRFVSDGREVKVLFGPAGANDQWPELPFDIVLPIGKRPRTFTIDAVGGSATLGELVLRAK